MRFSYSLKAIPSCQAPWRGPTENWATVEMWRLTKTALSKPGGAGGRWGEGRGEDGGLEEKAKVPVATKQCWCSWRGCVFGGGQGARGHREESRPGSADADELLIWEAGAPSKRREMAGMLPEPRSRLVSEATVLRVTQESRLGRSCPWEGGGAMPVTSSCGGGVIPYCALFVRPISFLVRGKTIPLGRAGWPCLEQQE